MWSNQFFRLLLKISFHLLFLILEVKYTMAILSNPIIEYEEKKSAMTDENENEIGDAEDQGMIAEMRKEKDPVKLFGIEFGKKWTFGIFKIMNTFLLLILAICAGMSIGANLFWFNILNAFPFLRIFCNNAIQCLRYPFVLNFSGFFLVSFFSMVAYWILRWKLNANKHSLCCIAIWDLVFSCLSIPVFFIAFANYGFMAALEWKWFFPKLINSSSSSLAEMTETKIYSVEEYWDYEGEYFKSTIIPDVQIPDWKIEQMESRRNEILIRLASDSSILILLAIMIPLNLFSVIRIRKMIKQTNLWLNLSEYSQFYKESSKIDKKYASFWPNGLFKFLFWFIPILYCILDDGLRFPLNLLPVFPLISLVMFFHWLYFIRRTRFRSMDDLEASKLEENVGKFRFSSMLKFDIFMSFGAIAFYIFLVDFYPIKNAFLLHLIHLIYIVISYGCELFLKGSSIKLLPKISISVNYNVVKGNENDTKAVGNGKNGEIDTKMVENGQQ